MYPTTSFFRDLVVTVITPCLPRIYKSDNAYLTFPINFFWINYPSPIYDTVCQGEFNKAFDEYIIHMNFMIFCVDH